MKISIKTATADLLSFRETYGKTLDEISKETGISVTTLIAIQKERTTPHAKTISRLNKYFTESEKVE